MRSIVDTKKLLFGDENSNSRQQAERAIEKYKTEKQERSFPNEMRRRDRTSLPFFGSINHAYEGSIFDKLKKVIFKRERIEKKPAQPDAVENHPLLTVYMVGTVISAFGQKIARIRFSPASKVSTDNWHGTYECYWESGYAGVGQEVMITRLSKGKIYIVPRLGE